MNETMYKIIANKILFDHYRFPAKLHSNHRFLYYAQNTQHVKYNNLFKKMFEVQDVPMQIAVPVSWQPGNTMPAATLAFFSNSKATKRSLLDASGSSRILASCYSVMRKKRNSWIINRKERMKEDKKQNKKHMWILERRKKKKRKRKNKQIHANAK